MGVPMSGSMLLRRAPICNAPRTSSDAAYRAVCKARTSPTRVQHLSDAAPGCHVTAPSCSAASCSGSTAVPEGADTQQHSSRRRTLMRFVGRSASDSLRHAIARAKGRIAARFHAWTAQTVREGPCEAQQQPQLQHVFCYSLAAVVPATMPGNGLPDLLTNRVFMVGLASWFVAQVGKIFTHRYKKGVWLWNACLQPGGMPSSHSSLCVGVTTAIAWQQGFGSPLFAAALCFSLCVMYDAMGIRQHAGKQAEVLNQVILELMVHHPMGAIKLKEVLGHTPRQVACGALLGILVGLLYPGGPWVRAAGCC